MMNSGVVEFLPAVLRAHNPFIVTVNSLSKKLYFSLYARVFPGNHLSSLIKKPQNSGYEIDCVVEHGWHSCDILGKNSLQFPQSRKIILKTLHLKNTR